MNTAPKLTVMSDTRFIPAAATPAIEVLSAEKIYSNGTRALLPVNLTINQGEFITLLGPSGCGKSTLLKMVAGLVEPSDGKLMLWRRGPASAVVRLPGSHPDAVEQRAQ